MYVLHEKNEIIYQSCYKYVRGIGGCLQMHGSYRMTLPNYSYLFSSLHLVGYISISVLLINLQRQPISSG